MFTIKGSLATDDKAEDVQLELLTLHGQVILKEKLPVRRHSFEKQVEIPASLANGNYMLRLHTLKAHQVFRLNLGR